MENYETAVKRYIRAVRSIVKAASRFVNAVSNYGTVVRINEKGLPRYKKEVPAVRYTRKKNFLCFEVFEFQWAHLLKLRTGSAEDGFNVLFNVERKGYQPGFGMVEYFISLDAAIAPGGVLPDEMIWSRLS